MPMFKIFVGNLDAKVTVEMLRPMFEPFGELDEVVVARDETGKSRGFAIVLYKDAMKGQLAIETLTGRKILGREIVINEAMKKGKKKMSAAEDSKPRGPFGPKHRAGGGSFGGSRAGFSRGGSFRAGAAGGPERRGASGGFSRNPRRGMGGAGPRPGGPAAGGPGGGNAGRPPAGPSRPPSGPAGRPPSPGGPPRPRPRDDDE
jgi:RNA recognition motif-containing protein